MANLGQLPTNQSINYSNLTGTPDILDIVFLHGNNAGIAAGATQSLVPGLSGFVGALNQITPIACVAKNLSVRLNGTQPASGSVVTTLMVNNVATALVVTITGSSTAGSYSDTTHSVNLVANDLFRLDVKNNATGTSANLTGFAFEVDF